MTRFEIIQTAFASATDVNINLVTKDVKFEQLGVDSFDAIEIVMDIEEALGIYLSAEEYYDFMSDTVGACLENLDLWLGPEFPIDGLLHLTEDQFERRYDPETDGDGNLYRQREWRIMDDITHLERAVDSNRCWTAVEDDKGNWCLVWGNHLVNRLYNVITSKSIEDPAWEVQVSDACGTPTEIEQL